MNSSQPYLLRAVYEWLLDNNCTPHISVNAMYPGVEVPAEFIKDGEITLNINPSAVTNLVMDNEIVAFSARFGGVPRELFVPVSAIMGIFARENGQGMSFDVTEPPEDPPSAPTPAPPSSEGKSPSKNAGSSKSHLRVVK